MADKIEGCDSMEVAEFELVVDGATARLIVSGAGHLPILLDFSQEMLFRVAGKMFATCDRIDHGQLMANMRIIAERMGIIKASDPSTPEVTPEAGAAVSGGVVSPPSGGSDPEVISLVKHAAAFHARASSAFDSMVGLGDALLAIAAHRGPPSSFSGDAAAALASDPPWRVEFSGGAFDVDVDVGKGLVLLMADESRAEIPDPSVALTLEESAMMGAVIQAASNLLTRSLTPISASAVATDPAPSVSAVVPAVASDKKK